MKQLSVFTRVILVSVGLSLLLVVVAAISLVIGTSFVGLDKILFGVTDGAESQRIWMILWDYRFPRTLLAAVTGGALALSGTVFQGVLRNPLADPYLVGIAAGGALGAVISIVLLGEGNLWTTSVAAFLGSLMAAGIVYGLANLKRGAGYTNTVILAGVIVAALMNAVMLLIISMSEAHQAQRVFFWLMGDLSLANYRKAFVAGSFLLLGGVVVYLNANRMNLLIAGEETAESLGMDVSKTRTLLMGTAALMTGAAVSVSGTIGFVGLVVPHMMRLLFGPDNRILIPASLIGGAAFLAAADCVARMVAYPMELPVGVITAMTGAPFFLYLLVRK